jgi:hypothetical protein
VLVYKFTLCLVIYPVRDVVDKVHLEMHMTGACVAQLVVRLSQQARTCCIVCVISMACGLAFGSSHQSFCLPFICTRRLILHDMHCGCSARKYLGFAGVLAGGHTVAGGVTLVIRWSHFAGTSPN